MKTIKKQKKKYIKAKMRIILMSEDLCDGIPVGSGDEEAGARRSMLLLDDQGTCFEDINEDGTNHQSDLTNAGLIISNL